MHHYELFYWFDNHFGECEQIVSFLFYEHVDMFNKILNIQTKSCGIAVLWAVKQA